MRDLCADLDDEDERQRCWEVYEYLTNKRDTAQSACVRELRRDGAPGPGCKSFDSLEHMVYELMAVGSCRSMYDVLRVELEMAKRGGGRRAPQGGSALPPEEREREEWARHLRGRAEGLFDEMDVGGRGFLDREAFLSAMHVMADDLGWDDDDIATVFDAIDCHGRVTKEQLSDIIVSEDLRDPGADAEVLRRVAHSRPGWWTDCPGSLLTV